MCRHIVRVVGGAVPIGKDHVLVAALERDGPEFVLPLVEPHLEGIACAGAVVAVGPREALVHEQPARDAVERPPRDIGFPSCFLKVRDLVVLVVHDLPEEVPEARLHGVGDVIPRGTVVAGGAFDLLRMRAVPDADQPVELGGALLLVLLLDGLQIDYAEGPHLLGGEGVPAEELSQVGLVEA